jgi:hypothetical protein
VNGATPGSGTMPGSASSSSPAGAGAASVFATRVGAEEASADCGSTGGLTVKLK